MENPIKIDDLEENPLFSETLELSVLTFLEVLPDHWPDLPNFRLVTWNNNVLHVSAWSIAYTPWN